MAADEKNNGKGEPLAPDPIYMWGAYAAVIVVAAVAVWLASKNDLTIGISEGFAPFAVIYIVAQAVERIVQPLTYLAGKPAEKAKAKQALTEAKTELALKAAEPAATATTVNTQQKKLEVIQADRAILFWAIATCLALLVCGLLDLGLIQSIAHVTDGADEVPDWFDRADVVLTGIAVGSGTKPLHDLIALVQNAKQKNDPAAGIA
jgi:predicted ribosome-associated RNA-binding protein Tma20